ncbi:MAG: hypothetical protein HY791_25965 [Deltaproteobacteria bacterium]|nr:hypothetical protein [Deltaproteobacteria bacterium]
MRRFAPQISLATTFVALTPAFADEIDAHVPATAKPSAVPWTSCTMGNYTHQSLPIRDYDKSGTTLTDDTKGPAQFSAEVDIASSLARDHLNEATCNPDEFGDVPTPQMCGPETSGLFCYYNGGTPATPGDDMLLMRLRVDGDPRKSGNDEISASHWNYLLDVEESGAVDGWKEFWIDVDGQAFDFIVRYQNTQSQKMPGPICSGASCPQTQEHRACTFDISTLFSPAQTKTLSKSGTTVTLTQNGASNPFTAAMVGQVLRIQNATNPANDGNFLITAFLASDQIQYEHAGAVAVTNDGLDWSISDLTICRSPTETGCDVQSRVRLYDTNDDHGNVSSDADEWWVDVQVPIVCLVDGDHVQTIIEDREYQIFYSTSDSSTDPLQKDFIFSCLLNPTTGNVCEDGTGTECSPDPTVSCGGTCRCLGFGDVLPVTLSKVWSKRVGESVQINWATASETGNAGFDILAVQGDGRVRKLNAQLIASQVVSSQSQTLYQQLVRDLPEGQFFIEDVSIRGERKRQGPFNVDESTGRADPSLALDWSGAAPVEAHAWSMVSSNNTAELLVSADGIYRARYEELRDAGIDLAGVRIKDLALRDRKGPVPMVVQGNCGLRTDCRFGPGSYIEFVGRREKSLYTEDNVYRLSVDPLRASRMSVGKVTTSGTTRIHRSVASIADDLAYEVTSPDSDPWYHTKLLATSQAVSAQFGVATDAPVAQGSATLRVHVWGGADLPEQQDHHVVAKLNGQWVGELRFDGLRGEILEVTVPAASVHAGINQVEVSLPFDTGSVFDLVYVDRVELDFPRRASAVADRFDSRVGAQALRIDGFSGTDVVAYAVGSSGIPVKLAGARASAAGSSYSAVVPALANSRVFVATGRGVFTPRIRPLSMNALPSGSADYLVITHPAFESGIRPLVDARRHEGHSVAVVSVNDVYGHFSNGVVDPMAIRSAIAWSQQALGAQSVLLVGGDTRDPLNHLGIGSVSFIPSLYVATGPIVRHAPSDAALADADGDGMEDIAIGRFPVRNLTELDDLVQKTLRYPVAGHAGSALFVADARGEIDFARTSDEILGSLPSLVATRAYVDSMGPANTRSTVLSELNRGVALTEFFGHSAATVWTFSGVFNASDALSLTNAGRPTVVMQMGCWNTYFVDPAGMSLAHALLLSGDRGAAAVLGSSTLTEAGPEGRLSRYLSEQSVEGGLTLGEAVVLAKRRFMSEGFKDADVLYGYNLLGDPALRVAR